MLEDQRAQVADRLSSLRLVKRDYHQRRERILKELSIWQARLDRLETEYAEVQDGGIEKAEARLAELDAAIHDATFVKPKVDQLLAIRTKLARELGCSVADLSERLRQIEEKAQ